MNGVVAGVGDPHLHLAADRLVGALPHRLGLDAGHGGDGRTGAERRGRRGGRRGRADAGRRSPRTPRSAPRARPPRTAVLSCPPRLGRRRPLPVPALARGPSPARPPSAPRASPARWRPARGAAPRCPGRTPSRAAGRPGRRSRGSPRRALVQRTRQVRAPADEDVDPRPAADGGQRHGDAVAAAGAQRGPALREVVERPEVDPVGGQRPRRRGRVRGARGLRVRHVPADRPPTRWPCPARRRTAPGRASRGPSPGPRARPRTARARRCWPPRAAPPGAGRRCPAPTSRPPRRAPSGRRRPRRCRSARSRRPQRRDEVEHAGGHPGSHRDVHHHRVQRVAQPRPVQEVPHRRAGAPPAPPAAPAR